MAGTRGLATFRGEQLRSGILRDRHFDVNNKINEDKINILWHNHREILEDTKIDVFVQANNQAVAGLSSLDVTSVIGGKPVSTGASVEGVVLDFKVEMRQTGSEDYPYIDTDGDRVYGKLRYDDTDPGNPKYFLDFYSMQPDGGGGEIETPYTFAGDAPNADFRYVLRTNLSVIPVDALVQGGSGFVEGATDANAYMNLQQLMKDIYVGGSLDNDGNANLAKPLVQQILDEIQARTDADQAIRDDFASTVGGQGASLVGVIADPNYTGATVQAALSDLAQRLVDAENGGLTEVTDTHSRESSSTNGYFSERTTGNGGEFTSLEERLEDIETVVDTELKDKEDRITKLETEDDRFVFEAVGGETQVDLPGGKLARPNTLFMSLNGAIQAPGVNYDEITDGSGNITGVNFAPDVLANGDVVFIWYKLVL